MSWLCAIKINCQQAYRRDWWISIDTDKLIIFCTILAIWTKSLIIKGCPQDNFSFANHIFLLVTFKCMISQLHEHSIPPEKLQKISWQVLVLKNIYFINGSSIIKMSKCKIWVQCQRRNLVVRKATFDLKMCLQL
jgi:hypothetical protein